jgi:hypothetical protein
MLLELEETLLTIFSDDGTNREKYVYTRLDNHNIIISDIVS